MDKFKMPFESMTIEHLGVRLYSTLPPVISELVSNAFDAESAKVLVTIPKGEIDGTSEVVVRDFGHGLTARELQDEYLPIGRNRRGAKSENSMSKNGLRKVTGRKGLGKLASFGVAVEMELAAFKDGRAVCIRLNYDEMKKWVDKHPGEPYEPKYIAYRSGKTKEKNGLEVRLRGLIRKKAIDEDEIRKGLARRLDVIGSQFKVFVNNREIQPGDRVRQGDCAHSWLVDETPGGGNIGDSLSVSGWIGFLAKSSQTGRGVSIFASGKAVELGSTFEYAGTDTQFARAYLVGEISADFLDQEEDLAATARNSVLWETPKGALLRTWGQKTLRWAFAQWLEKRRAAKQDTVIKTAGFDVWLKNRTATEQKVASRMVKLLVDDPDMEPKSVAPLLDIVKGSVETVAFRDLIDAIENDGITVGKLLKLFDEWRIIEAREHLRLADGRMNGIQQLEGFIRTGALEVQDMQPLFERHPWLINPMWKEADGQSTYTTMLRKFAKEKPGAPVEDRRIDILGIRAAGGVTVVELKHPEKVLSRKDLEQIERYVDWMDDKIIGSGADAVKYVDGLLVVGHLSSTLKQKVRRLAGDDIRVETYEDLRLRAIDYYGQVEKILEKIAPEYARAKWKKKPAPPKPPVFRHGLSKKAVKHVQQGR